MFLVMRRDVKGMKRTLLMFLVGALDAIIHANDVRPILTLLILAIVISMLTGVIPVAL